MTCAEVGAVGLPAIYVPLPIGNGEQRRNAEPIVAAGGGVLVDDAEIGDRLADLVTGLAAEPGRLAAMGAAARHTQTGDAAGALLEMAERAAARHRRPHG
jgi:UDP-N-acetylglucosamine--N-acetylmuramyl-(pentapeptide) pyrophosphoryl-undecaprenol N-acetylglucosamine transferase